MSFRAWGMPCIGPLSTPLAKSASAAAASASALSFVTVMKLEIKGSIDLMRSSAWSVRAIDVTEPLRSIAPASAIEQSCKALVMSNAPRHAENGVGACGLVGRGARLAHQRRHALEVLVILQQRRLATREYGKAGARRQHLEF